MKAATQKWVSLLSVGAAGIAAFALVTVALLFLKRLLDAHGYAQPTWVQVGAFIGCLGLTYGVFAQKIMKIARETDDATQGK
jgi:hypothetical protein